MAIRADKVFLNESTSAENGSEYLIPNVGSNTVMGLSIFGTAATYTIHFEAKGNIGDYQVFGVWDETKMDLITSATETSGKLFTVDLTGKVSFRVRLSSVTGGYLSASGKVIE